MKRFILGMIPSLIVLNIFAITSLFSLEVKGYTEVKVDDESIVYAPTKNVVCVKQNKLTECQNAPIEGIKIIFEGIEYEIHPKRGVTKLKDLRL